jgi:hypothetical protein
MKFQFGFGFQLNWIGNCIFDWMELDMDLNKEMEWIDIGIGYII